MRVINLSEYREKRLLRSFRQSGDHNSRLLKSQGGAYDQEAFFFNHMLYLVCREREVRDIQGSVGKINKKYTTFGIKGKYRSAPVFYVLYQESERILFTKKCNRTIYDRFILDHILTVRDEILIDLTDLLNKIDSFERRGSDDRITSIRTKLVMTIAYFSK